MWSIIEACLEHASLWLMMFLFAKFVPFHFLLVLCGRQMSLVGRFSQELVISSEWSGVIYVVGAFL